MATKNLDPSTDPRKNSRTIQIEFLFLDLNRCTRCVGTDKNLEEAIRLVKQIAGLSNLQLSVNKILIDSPEKASAHHFISSPTIRVNGQDITLEAKESQCDSCTDLCACEEGTHCRIWIYQGEEYTEAPIGMIVDAILQEIYRNAPQQPVNASDTTADIPKNLARFFSARQQQTATESSSCCSEKKQANCCEPQEKSSCCSIETAADIVT